MSHYPCRSAIIAIALACSPVCAQETVTHTYRGFVEEVVGVLPGAIQLGEPVVITYSLDTTAIDLYPDDPNNGMFRDNAAGLRVSLPTSGLNVAGTGQLQTFDNTDNPDDQISMYIPNIVEHDQLMNHPVISLGMAIISDAVDASGTPNMLDGDGIPTQRLIGKSHVIFVETALGYTNFRFSVDGADPTVEELVEDGLLQLQRAASAGLVVPGIALSLSKKLEEVLSSHQSEDVGRACHWVDLFGAQLGGVSHAKTIDSETVAQLDALANGLRRALSRCVEPKR